jgi:pentatricopeptide repeat protein
VGDADGSSHTLATDAGLLRRVVSTSTAAEALELLLDAQPKQQQQQGQQQPALSAADANLLLERSLEAANAPLALSLYQQLCAAKQAQVQGGSSSSSTTWPAATLQHTDTLIRGLCRQLRVAEALTTLRSIRSQGVHASDAEVRRRACTGWC